MGRARQFFITILAIEILAIEILLCCAVLGRLCGGDHGLGFNQARAEATKSSGSVDLVPPLQRVPCAFSTSTPSALHQAQQTPFARSTATAINSCSLPQDHGFEAAVLALQHLPRGYEGHVPPLLEVWTGVEHLSRRQFHSARTSTTTALRPSFLEQSAVARFWFLESPHTIQAINQESQAEQGQWTVARRRSTKAFKRWWQGTGAVCPSTGSHATIYAISIPTDDDAATSSTSTADRQRSGQGSWFDRNDQRRPTPWTCYALGKCPDDAISYAAYVPILVDKLCKCYGTTQWSQARGASAATAQPTSQRDPEGGGQAVAPLAIHCTRDPEAGGKEQYQKPISCCPDTWRCQAGPLGSRECEGTDADSVEAVHPADPCQVEGIYGKLSSIGKCPPTRSSSCPVGCSARPESVRCSFKEGAGWEGGSLHNLRQRHRADRRCDGGSPWRWSSTRARWYELHCGQLGGTFLYSRSAGAENQEAPNLRRRCWHDPSSVFWEGRCGMTDEYPHQRPTEGPVISSEAVRLHWSHSILEEPNYLSEWQAQENASTLADEMGSSFMLRVDVLSLPLRKRSMKGAVTFCEEVEVSIGHAETGEFRSSLIAHDTLKEFKDKPWGYRSRHPDEHDQSIQPFDETSFMARRPTQPHRQPITSSSSTSTSSDDHSSDTYSDSVDMRSTVLVLMDGRMLPAELPWNDADAIVPLILRALDDPAQELYGAHHVRHRPPDLVRQQLECLLVQTQGHPRPSTFMRLVLVDLEIYEPNEILPGAFRRHAIWLPETLNRVSAFRLLGLENLLHDHPESSHLWFNNIEVLEGTVSPMYLQDGDYFRFLIGEPIRDYSCTNSTSTSFQVNATDDDDHFSSLQKTWSSSTSTNLAVRADADPLFFDDVCISRRNSIAQSRQPITASTNEPFSFFSATSTASNDVDDDDSQRLPPSEDQPGWYHRLWTFFQQNGDVERDDEGPVVYLASHYISHEYHLSNAQYRPLRIDTEHAMWLDDLKFMWEDLYDQYAPYEVFFVDPTPPLSPTQSFVATILIVQHPHHDLATCAITTHDDGESPQILQQSAHATRHFIPVDALIALSGYEQLCSAASHTARDRCQLRHGDHVLPHDQDVRILNGLGLTLMIPRARLIGTFESIPTAPLLAADPDDAPADEHDEVQLFSSSPSVASMSNWHSAHGTPYQCGINLPPSSSESSFYHMPAQAQDRPMQWNPQTPDPFINDLFGLWDLLAITWEDEPRSGTVLVWFVDHQWDAPYCLAPRPVRLTPAFRDWRLHMWQAWAELIVPGTELEYHLVIPKPPTMERNIIAHVLLVQRPRLEWATIIVSCFDSTPPHPEVRQLAITTRNLIQLEDMLRALGLYVACCAPQPTAHCHAWYRDYVFSRRIPMPGHSGLAVILQISSVQHLPTEEPRDQEDVSMLQVNGHARKRQSVQTLSLDDLLPSDPKVIVDFTHAAEAYYAIMNVTFEYLKDWPDDLDLPEETLQALAALQDHQQVPVTSYHFYVDGSKVAGYGVGAATACLTESADGMTLAGVIPTHVDFAEHAYIGEHVAMLHALLWAIQLSAWHMTHLPHLPVSFSFNFDALNTGYQAAGWWRAHEHKEWQTLFRSIAHVLEHRHGSRQIAWNHIRAHAQHPWNELVDRVAKFASKHPTQVGDCRQWHHWISDAPFLVAVQWIWYLEAMRAQCPQVAPLRGLLLEHTLRKPVHQTESHDVSEPALPPAFTDIQVDMIWPCECLDLDCVI